MIDIPTFELHGNGSITLEGINIVIVDIRAEDDHEDESMHNIAIDYNIIDDVHPTNIEDFEQTLCRFMMSLTSVEPNTI